MRKELSHGARVQEDQMGEVGEKKEIIVLNPTILIKPVKGLVNGGR
jgi:hypothetical protein